MPYIPAITTSPGLWNTVTIAGITYPGICKVRGGKPLKITHKSPPGFDSGQFTQLGFGDASITLEFIIADEPGEDKQWRTYQQIAALLQPSRGQPIQGIDVHHPALAVYGITSLYLKHLGIPEQSGETPDMLRVLVQMSQFASLKNRKANTASHAKAAFQDPTTPAGALYAQLKRAPTYADQAAFVPGPDQASAPSASQTPSSTTAGATYNPEGGVTQAPGALEDPASSQAGPPQYDPNGGFG